MPFSAVGGRAGLQARVPGLDEMGFSPGANAWSIYEMGSRVRHIRLAASSQQPVAIPGNNSQTTQFYVTGEVCPL